MHCLLETTATSILAQAQVLAVWSSVWPYLVMLLGFSAIVFVHELGHFLVAKWVGIRVEKFAIGFGRELLGFTRGETRYSFNILPLGGYVKMLGQEDFDDKANELRFTDDPRSFVNKPVGHRMVVVSAGVVMNVLFTCLLFMIVFMVGMESLGTRIAYVDPDSPAQKAGLLPGDRITKINGERMLEFKEITFAVLLAPPHEPIEFIVERDGDLVDPIYLTPEYRLPESTRDLKRQMVGIGPGVTQEIVAVGPEIDTSKPDFPHIGDMLVEIDGIAVTEANASQSQDILAYSTGDIFVERKDPEHPDAPPERVRVNIPPILAIYPSELGDENTISILGLTPLVRFGFVGAQGRAHLARIDIGDTILSFDDLPHPSKGDVSQAIRDNAERDVPFTVRKSDGRIVNGFVRPKRNKRGAATIQAGLKSIDSADRSEDGPRATFTYVRPGGIAHRVGVEEGDVILACDGHRNPTRRAATRSIRGKADKDVPLTIRKQDGRIRMVMLRPQAPGTIDATHTLVAHDLLRTGRIVPTINGRTSPAAEAGIGPGVRILTINDQPLAGWLDLIAAFETHAGATVELAFVDQQDRRHSVPFRVPHCLRTVLGVGPEARILTINGRNMASVEKGNRAELVSVQHRVGAQAILTELIGQTHVPVAYRDNPWSAVETKYIDVTADMVDPWLARVALSNNIALAGEMILLKGDNALDAVRIGIHKTYYFILQVYEIMNRMIFSRSVSVENMTGPLGIIDVGGRIARSGVVYFLFFLAILSANLAVINFLPLPIVDGGLMVFLIIEKIKGSPVSLRVQVATQVIGIILIVGAFGFVTYQDFMRMFG